MRIGRWSIRPLVAWYDLWIGVYVDRPNRRLYILPFPCVGFVVRWPDPEPERWISAEVVASTLTPLILAPGGEIADFYQWLVGSLAQQPVAKIILAQHPGLAFVTFDSARAVYGRLRGVEREDAICDWIVGVTGTDSFLIRRKDPIA